MSDSDVSQAKLAELLEEHAESSTLEFVGDCNLSNRRDVVELASEVGALAARGGWIVVGVDDHGEATGMLDEAKAQKFDEAALRDKLARYLPPSVEIRVARHALAAGWAVLIHVAAHADGAVVFAADGAFDQEDGKQRIAFHAGDIFVRHGTKSERPTQEDIGQLQARLGAASAALAERRRAEEANWPRLFPAPSTDWISGRGGYAGEAGSRALPIKNGGPGTALNVSGDLDFTNQDGPLVRFVPTSIGAGDTVDLQIDWPRPPAGHSSAGGPAIWSGSGVETNWRNVRGRLYYEDVDGGRWLTWFNIEAEGPNGYRRVWVRETELAQRSDGKTLSPPESFDREAWYTSSG